MQRELPPHDQEGSISYPHATTTSSPWLNLQQYLRRSGSSGRGLRNAVVAITKVAAFPGSHAHLLGQLGPVAIPSASKHRHHARPLDFSVICAAPALSRFRSISSRMRVVPAITVNGCPASTGLKPPHAFKPRVPARAVPNHRRYGASRREAAINTANRFSTFTSPASRDNTISAGPMGVSNSITAPPGVSLCFAARHSPAPIPYCHAPSRRPFAAAAASSTTLAHPAR